MILFAIGSGVVAGMAAAPHTLIIFVLCCYAPPAFWLLLTLAPIPRAFPKSFRVMLSGAKYLPMSARRLFATLRVTAENAPFYLVKGKWKSPAPIPPNERLDPWLEGALQQFQKAGQQQVMRGPWAGFWEQWLIAEALRRWPEATQRLAPPLQNAMASWPISISIRLILSGSEESHPTSKHSFAQPDWEAEMPSWFADYVRQNWAQGGDDHV